MTRRDFAELGLMALAFLAYFAVRGAVIDRPPVAYDNALRIVELQRTLGIYWEDDLNAWAAARVPWAQAMNIAYFWLHFPLIAVFGVWLYFARRHQYTFLRDAFFASGGISLVCYLLFPVAPPREMPALAAEFDPNAPAYVLGFVDTMQEHLGYAYQTQTTRPFVNPYAAMPSLHFGWDLLLGLGVARAFWPNRAALALGVLLPAVQVPAVVLTANHFFLDVAAGAVVALAGLGVAWGIQQWAYPRLSRAFAPPERNAA